MTYLDNAIKNNAGIAIYNCELFSINQDNPISQNIIENNNNKRYLKKEGTLENEFHQQKGHYKNLERFVKGAVLPLAISTLNECKQEKNMLFSKIYSEDQPIIITPKYTFLFKENGTGNFKINIDNATFSSYKQIPTRQIIRKIEIEEDNRKQRLSQRYKQGKISLEKNSNGYKILQNIKEFKLEWNNHKYRFPATKIEMTIEDRGENIKISEPLMHNDYNHPFVFNNRRICFNGDERWIKLGINFNRRQPPSIKLARDIRTALQESRYNLIGGYQDGISPVKLLTPENFSEELIY